MNKKSMTLLMLSLLFSLNTMANTKVMPFSDEDVEVGDAATDRKNCNDRFCNLTATNACIENLTAGTLSVDGVSVNFTTLATIINIFNTTGANRLVRSVIPFSSGLIDLATILSFPAEGIVMGFGSGSLVNVVAPLLPTVQTAYSFTVPENGTLFNLRVSVDAVFAALPGTTIPFRFTVLRSPCVNGAIPTYTATSLFATASTTTTALLSPAGTTGCGNSGAKSLAVTAGDRITIRVTTPATILPTLIADLAFSAGIEFAPTLVP